MTLSFVGEEDGRTGPHYQAGWANDAGQTCFVSVNLYTHPHPGGNKLHLHLMRWGAHELIGRRNWELPPDASPGALRGVLEEALNWSNDIVV